MKATLQALLIVALAIATIGFGVWIVRPLASAIIPAYPINLYTRLWLTPVLVVSAARRI